MLNKSYYYYYYFVSDIIAIIAHAKYLGIIAK
jgi:hypothetical protein